MKYTNCQKLDERLTRLLTRDTFENPVGKNLTNWIVWSWLLVNSVIASSAVFATYQKMTKQTTISFMSAPIRQCLACCLTPKTNEPTIIIQGISYRPWSSEVVPRRLDSVHLDQWCRHSMCRRWSGLPPVRHHYPIGQKEQELDACSESTTIVVENLSVSH